MIEKIQIISPAFNYGDEIPSKYTCDSENISPPLRIDLPSDNAKSLVIIMDDPDAMAGLWDHWIVYNIQVSGKRVNLPESAHYGVLGKNSWEKKEYGGPCPSRGRHRYFFRVYALDKELEISTDASRILIEKMMAGHVIGEGSIMGTYERKSH